MPPHHENIIKLKLVPGIGNKTILKILNDSKDFFVKPVTINMVSPFLDDTQKALFLEVRNRLNSDFKTVAGNIIQNSIGLVSIHDKTYPKQLRSIYNPPAVLFFKGDIGYSFRRSVAVVGTRKFTEYGKNTCEKFVTHLVQNNISIISGLASGIDAIAHITALKEAGKCIGVIGHGFDFCFPEINRRLYQNVLDSGGGIISEYLPFEPPHKGNFPARNRIISGLAKKLLVVEAAEKSGSLITANLAFGEGRDVYAVPADITRKTFQGCNELIKSNIASLASTPADILRDFGYKTESKSSDSSDLFKTFEEQYQPLYQLIMEHNYSTDELAAYLNADVVVINQLLTELELTGAIRRDSGRRWNVV